ncbi:hypothetical protein QBC34DRAFT_446437 [Podospora aff. communis PSN243]|uniref:C2H2-type domain-containing protein n=1 Tax=Podospora aff. communis PSN243 TaxID=3040156 RepID=A0AAV9GZZ6_9PEZI|nr:hypothetical protein QBC34DRAFT_446437 [Podospora aff. communis PSN243]
MTRRSPPPDPPSPPSPPLTRTNSRSSAAAGTGFLTPSSGVASDGLSPASGGVNTGSSGASQPGSNHALYYPGTWPTPGGLNSAYTYTPTSSAPVSASLGQPHQYQRSSVYGQVSPSLTQFGGRTASSPANADSLPQPSSSYQDHGSFPSPIGAGGGGGGGGHGHGHHAQQQQQQQQSQHQQSHQHQQQHHHQQPHQQQQQQQQQQVQQSQEQPPQSLHAHAGGLPQPSGQQQNAAAVSSAGAPEGNHYRQPQTPAYAYPASSTPQQASYPSFQGPPPQPSPTAPSPTTTGALNHGLLTSAMRPPHMAFNPRPIPPMGTYAPYGQLGGPVMSNVHHPGTPMAVVGGGGMAPHMGHNYGHHLPYSMHGHHHHPGGPSAQERPFKCDQCPQSFNRNHDLKRHKRIHLSVKPFPCCNCDKSFSRKDALKRHRLVKGHTATDNDVEMEGPNGAGGDDGSAPSDDGQDSPRIVKKE